MRVCKFGGAALRDGAAFRRVGQIVREEPARRIIVPSAPGKRDAEDEKITDLLYACHSAAADGRAFAHLFDRAAQRYRQIAGELGLPLPDGALRAVYQGLREGASAAWAASRGEWLSALLLSQYLKLPLVDAAEVIRFDGAGRLLEGETLRLLRARLGGLPGAVLPGFYGADAAGTVFTFPRGGSDVTGALAAAALNAEVYENWKDVRGVFAADPALVADARCVPEMSYRALRAYSRLGAQVLHEAAVAPLRRAGIRMNIRSFAETRHPGTWIHGGAGEARPHVIGVTGRVGVALLRLTGIEKGSEMTRAALAAGLLPQRLAADADTLCLLLQDGRELPAGLLALADAHALTPRLAMLSAVGEHIDRLDGAARLSEALTAAGIPVLALHQPPEGLYVTALIAQEEYGRGVNAAYDAFIRT